MALNRQRRRKKRRHTEARCLRRRFVERRWCRQIDGDAIRNSGGVRTALVCFRCKSITNTGHILGPPWKRPENGCKGKPCVRKPMSFTSPQETTFLLNSCALKLSSPRLNKKVSAVVSEEKVVESNDSGTNVFRLTYLEGNSWLWEVGGAKILVDPILVGNLDFGLPWLYDAAKKVLKNFKLDDLPEINCLLITQSLDDHCHLKTIKPLSQKLPNLRVIATPNAKPLLDPLFTNVTYLEPGQDSEIQLPNGSSVKLRATAGPVLGPPWQRPENGYIVTSPEGELALYYEPHCVYNKNLVGKERADIVITPVVKQLLPNFTLVSGQEDAVSLAKLLHAKFIVPMKNGDLDSKGPLASLVRGEGTIESFKEILLKELPDAKVLEPTIGVPLEIPPSVNSS